jgi:hypothetical protein
VPLGNLLAGIMHFTSFNCTDTNHPDYKESKEGYEDYSKLILRLFKNAVTKHHGQVNSTPATYFGGPGFKTPLRHIHGTLFHILTNLLFTDHS